MALADLDRTAILQLAALIASFLIGTILSGLLIQNSALRHGRPYGFALLLESLLLGAAIPLLNHGNLLGIYLASCACGLQNAMVSTYSGAVIRTTHVSGMFTDLGIFLGHFMRGLPVDALRLRLCVLIISGFLCGGVLGAVAFRHLGYFCLLIPAGITATAALAYGLTRLWPRKAKG